jgi:CBS domain-containing protein
MATRFKLFGRSEEAPVRRRARGSGPVTTFLAGLGFGSVIAYYLDPRLGRQRRARAHDKAWHLQRAGGREVLAVEHDLANRARGWLARLRTALEPEDVSDEVLHARVRAALGRACSHASALEVSVERGSVKLSGPVLEREHHATLRQIGRVRGVRAIEDRLERHMHPAGVSGLQGNRAKSVPTSASSSDESSGVSSCGDIMKRQALTVSEDDTIQLAAEKMALANVGFLPVCDRNGKVLGAITDRDIAIRAVAVGLSPATCTVNHAMTRDVVACRADDDLAAAENLMAQRQVSRLLVTDEDGTLKGVISLSDVAQREPARRAAATLRAVSAREAPRH